MLRVGHSVTLHSASRNAKTAESAKNAEHRSTEQRNAATALSPANSRATAAGVASDGFFVHGARFAGGRALGVSALRVSAVFAVFASVARMQRDPAARLCHRTTGSVMYDGWPAEV